MRLTFAGTPEFARVALAHLVAAGHEIVLVLTQPDRPAGRGLKLQASPVKQLALELGIPVQQPRSLRLEGRYPDDAQAARLALSAAAAQAMVVAAYGLILPQWVLDEHAPSGAPASPPDKRYGCLNIHASLLPRWRGAAPIQRALEAGDSHTGVTIMQMDAGLDTGDILLMEQLAIAPDDTAATLHDKLAELGGRLIVQALADVSCGALQGQPQPVEGVSYAHKLARHEGALDWSQPAASIERRIRAFNPFPGATAQLGQESLKIWRAQLLCTEPAPGQAGQVLAVTALGIDVATGQGVMRLQELQRAGGKRLAAQDFLRGFPIQPGQVFSLAAHLSSDPGH